MTTTSSDIMNTADRVMAATYARTPIVITKGEGCTLWDETGKQYTDFVAGIAVCNLGHAHPKIAAALCRQAATLWHVSNLFYTVPQTELADFLIQNSFADRAFFCNSGAEANEAAIKLARKYFRDRGETRRYQIVSMEKSFHGRTMATLSATGQDKIKKGFDPVLEGFRFVPFNDAAALERAVDGDTCAVIIEPIQGEGGVRCPDDGYLQQVRRICDKAGALLIFDEIQTGIGRTGTLFAYEHFKVVPDIMTLAKALANGLPVGAMLAREPVAAAFGPGAHASTFGGTPLVTAAALAVLKTLVEDGILDHCRQIGAYFKERLEKFRDAFDCVADVRGEGLLLGMELTVEGAPIARECMQQGFLVNCIQERVLRFIPPLIVDKPRIDALLDCLEKILAGVSG